MINYKLQIINCTVLEAHQNLLVGAIHESPAYRALDSIVRADIIRPREAKRLPYSLYRWRIVGVGAFDDPPKTFRSPHRAIHESPVKASPV